MKKLLVSFILLLSACSGGAVVFAPTPAPPDASPLVYTHPSGAFRIAIPRQWALYEQYTTTVASAAFSPPGASFPAVHAAVIQLDENIDTANEDAAFARILDRYQTQVRADAGQYAEFNREAMGDGSWRMSGVRQLAENTPQVLNTFIEREDAWVGVVEVVITGDAALESDLARVVNSFEIVPQEENTLEAADLSALTFAKPNALNILHVAHWVNADGVFFITGEIANTGDQTLIEIPIGATLYDAAGVSVAGAVDTVMGRGVPPGGFAPFSLRFGSGQPQASARYALTLGEAWQPTLDATLIGDSALTWTDAFRYDEINRLVIEGTVTNMSDTAIRDVRAVATVFDLEQNVIGASFIDAEPSALAAGETGNYRILVPDLGGEPMNYLVTVSGLPADE